METMTDRREVAANAVSANVVAGKPNEILTRPSIVRLFATAENIGVNATLMVGNRTFLNDQEVSGANRFPRLNEDGVCEAAGMPGDRILLTFRNTTAGALDAFSLIQVQPVA